MITYGRINNLLKLSFEEFINGGHFTALGAVSIALLSSISLGVNLSWIFLLSVFLGGEIIYLYNHYKEKESILANSKITLLIISLFILVLVKILITTQKTNLLVFTIVLIIIGLLYTIFLKNVTKYIIGFKEIFVSFCWALIVIFTALFLSASFNMALLLIFSFVWISLLIQEILLDLRDIEKDKKLDLLTLPIVLNKKILFFILSFLSILAIIPLIYGVYLNKIPFYSLIIIFVFPYNLMILKYADKIYKNNLCINILVDGQKILWGILALIFYKL